MNCKLFDVAVCLSIAAAVTTTAAPARAQTTNYSVESRALTGGMPGSGATYVGPLIGETSSHADNDPPALAWIHNLNQQLFSDAHAESWTEIGALVGHASTLAQRVQATNFPAGVTATSMGRYTDRVQVVSATLPKGTPVTLTFHNTMTIDWQGAGLHEGNATCNLQVGGYASYSKWSVGYNKAELTSPAAPLVVKTTVGAVLAVSGRLDTFARASFFVPGPRYDGDMSVDATCDNPLVATSGDVQLVAESGVDYANL